MREHRSGVGCGVVEWVKRSTRRWFGHIERMGNEEFVKKVYLSSAEGMNRRGRPLGRWKNRVKEYFLFFCFVLFISKEAAQGQNNREKKAH